MSYRTQRLLALVLLGLFFPSVGAAVAAYARPIPQHYVVYALDVNEHVLAPGAQLTSGQHITVVATGFRAGTSVQVVDTARRRMGTVHADSTGTARTAFVVPRRGVRVSVALAGVGAISSPIASFPSVGRGDPQAIVVTVPLLRRYPYRIGGSGTDAGGVGLGGGTETGGHGGEGGGGLASTGLDVLALSAAGLLLIVLGSVVWQLGRRRTQVGVGARRTG